MSDLLSDDELADAKAADLVAYLGDHPEEADRVEAAEESRDDPRLTVLAALEKARDKAEEPEAMAEPEAADEELEQEPADPVPADDDEPDPEEAEVVADPEPVVEETSDPEPVTFVCDQWAGVSLFGKDIKFEGGRYVTSDPKKIGVLDAWEHARREA